jgi:MFS family permease
MLTQIFSLLGSSMTAFAIGIWLYVQTGNTTPLVLVSLFGILPPMLLNSFSGVIADRFSRKKLIILGDAAQAVPTLLLMLAFATGTFQVWMLYVGTLVQAFFGMLQGPATEASITMLVPPEERRRANAIRQTASPAAGLLAPPLAGALYGLIGVPGVMLIDLMTFLVAVVVVLRIAIPQPARTDTPETRRSPWQDIKEALAFLKMRPGLLVLILYFTFLNFINNGAFRLLSPYVIALTGSESFAGLVQGIFSGGLVVGGLITIVWHGTRNHIDTILPGLAFAGVMLVGLGLARDVGALLIVAFVAALPYKMTNALLASIYQSKIPPEMQGRVFALMSQLSVFAIPLVYIITGPLVDQLFVPAIGKADWWAWVDPIVGHSPAAGIALYMVICGVLQAVITLLVYALPSVRRIESTLPDYVVDGVALGLAGDGD